MNSPAVCAFTPPVGSSFTSGSGPRSAFRYLGPPTADAGKIFTMSAPAFQAVITSVGVSAPGMIGMPRAWAAAMVAEVEARADDERRAGVDAGVGRLRVQHGAGADDGAIAELVDERADDRRARRARSS